ncbi:hypothetical protein AB7M37_006307 [Sinorhizobium fredii]
MLSWTRKVVASGEVTDAMGPEPTGFLVLPNLGGSLPNDIFSEILGLPTIWVPHSYPGCSQHAPNEHLPAAHIREGLAVMAGIYWDVGEAGTPQEPVVRIGHRVPHGDL